MLAIKRKMFSLLIAVVLVIAAVSAAFYTSTLNSAPIKPESMGNVENIVNSQSDENTTEPKSTPCPTVNNTPAPLSSGSSEVQPQKQPPTYDSGWINITGKAGAFFNVSHNLNSSDISVKITGKTRAEDQENTWPLASWDLKPGFNLACGAKNDGAFSVAQSADGGYAFFGYTSLACTPTQAWLIKVNSTGALMWNRTYGGNDWGIGECVICTSDGGYALLANLIHYDTNDYDFWLIKTDSNGEPQWNQTYGGSGDEHAETVVVTSDGGYAILGSTQTFGAGQNDFWLVKTDSLGRMEWNRTYGKAGIDQAYSLIKTNDGGYALAGITGSEVNYDFWLIKTDAAGNAQWHQTYVKKSGGFVCSVVQTQDGGYAMAGRSVSTVYDVWLVKMNANGTLLWERSFGSQNYADARCMIETIDGGFAITGLMDSAARILKTDSLGNLKWSEVVPNGRAGECIIEDSDGYLVVAGQGNQFDVLMYKTCLPTGLSMTGISENTVTLYRDLLDARWNYVRVVVTKH
jgi:hypothetical protein